MAKRNRPGWSLRNRLWLALSGMTILPTVVLIAVAYSLTVRSIEQWADTVTQRALDASLEVTASLEVLYISELADEVERVAYDRRFYDAYLKRDAAAVRESLPPLIMDTEVVAVYDASGMLWLTFPEGAAFPPNTASFLEPLSRIRREPEQVVNSALTVTEDTGNRADYVLCAYPLFDDESRAFRGIVVVGKRLPFARTTIQEGHRHFMDIGAQQERAQRVVFLILLVAGGTLVVGAFLLSRYLSGRLARPIGALVAGTREIGGGNLQHRIPEPRMAEFAQLARAFNQMTEELSERTEELRRVEKTVVWREVAQKLAHELKNPLTPILLSAQRLKRRYYSNRDGYEELLNESTATIEREVASLRLLLDEFSRLARLPEPNPSATPVTDLIETSLAAFEGEETSLVSFRIEIPENLPLLWVDETQMRQVFHNLMKNAVEAMPDGGELTLFAADDGNRSVTVLVDDTGEGISPEVRERLFLPHVSTKREGHGLGLAIVRKIIEDHQGTIVIEPNPSGRGTRVRLTLPTAYGHEAE